MYIYTDGVVEFAECDMPFVKKFGLVDATNMVLDYCSVNSTPFIYDAHQLADFFIISPKKLFSTVRNAGDMYFINSIPKSDGTERQLQVPHSFLKSLQTCILKHILYEIPVSKYATAYKPHAKLVDNALPHVNRKYVLKMDITDFFGSITFTKVYSEVFNTTRFSKQVGTMLTTLCCYREYLPQGSPTSPAISNIVMKRFDDYIGEWCEKRGIAYTRYCDDMTFSSDKPLYYVYKKVSKMLEDMGFEVNEKKTHFISDASRQTVTGLTVNDKIAVPKQVKRKLRQELYYARKFGLYDALMHSGDERFFSEGRPDTFRYFCYLIGKVSYIVQVEPDNEWFRNAFNYLKNY